MDKISNNPVTDFLGKTAAQTAEAFQRTTDVTLDVSEKTVNALDPLHLFAPNPNPTRLVLPKDLFSLKTDFPILHARSNDPFHDLVVKAGSSDDELIMTDASSGAAVLVVGRTPEPRMYDIYKTTPITEGQQATKTTSDGTSLHLRAKLVMSDNDLKVFMDNQDEALYTVTKSPGLLNVSTARIIMMKGMEKPVASTSDWEDTSYMLEIMPVVDAGLMMCLAICDDDCHTEEKK
jgi:hypothetical protein